MDKEFLDKLINVPDDLFIEKDEDRLNAYTVRFNDTPELLVVHAHNFGMACVLAMAWAIHTGGAWGVEWIKSHKTGAKLPGYQIISEDM